MSQRRALPFSVACPTLGLHAAPDSLRPLADFDADGALSRRAALKGLAGLGLGTAMLMSNPAAALADQFSSDGVVSAPGGQQQDFWTRDRTIWARRTATGEVIKSTYWSNGRIIESEYQKLCWFARDITLERLIRENSPHIRSALDRGLFTPEQISQWTLMSPISFDIHYALTSWLAWFNMARPIEWTSAFRHPITNGITEGAVRDSWHIRGGAIDSTIPGVPTEQFGKFAQWLGAGGVGVYVTRSFTHTDAGRVRSWRS